MNDMNKKSSKFNLRSFTSFSLVISTIVMSWSGFILYVAPPGRIANWGDWRLMLFNKAEWMALHTIFSYLFFILVIIHLFFVNWRTFLTYIKSKLKAGLNKRWELIAASLLSLIIFIGTLYSWTPFGPVMTFGEKVKGRWEGKYTSGPVAHMEEYTLEKIAADFIDTTPQELVKTLSENGIKVSGYDQLLKKIAAENRTTPSAIYEILTTKYKKTENSSAVPAGTGKLTVRSVSESTGKDIASILNKLKEKSIDANQGTTMREVAEKMGCTPKDAYLMLSEK
jgi:hypothetical protein